MAAIELEERNLLNEDEQEDVSEPSEEDFISDVVMEETKDPILEAIGEFGVYQFYICMVGFFFTIPHCWVSLSLKFVGMRTNFTCADLPSVNNRSFDGACQGPNGPCQEFWYDQSQFRSTIIERWNLVCDREGLDSIAQSVFFSGCLFGVFTSGVLADRFGRKPVLMGLIILFSISGVLGGLTQYFYVWLTLRFFLGAASIGMSTVRFTIQVELIGSKYRTWGNTLNGIGWSVGYMLLPVMAYIIPDMAHLEVFIGLCGVPFLSFFWLHPESPKWLLTVGRQKESEDVAERICRWNNKPFKGFSYRSPVKQESKQTELRHGITSILKYPNMRRNLFCMGLVWFSVGMTYFGIALHTPEFGSNVFMVFFLGGLMELPMNFVGPWLLNTLGRKTVMMSSFFICAACLFLSGIIPTGMFYKEWLTVTLITIGKLGVSACFETCYIWTSEIFPTVIRNSSVSACSSCARIGAIIAPLIVEIDKDNPMAPILIYGMVSLAAGFNTLLIHPESKDCINLPNSLEDGEQIATRHRPSQSPQKKNPMNLD